MMYNNNNIPKYLQKAVNSFSGDFNIAKVQSSLQEAMLEAARGDEFLTKKSFSPSTIGFGYGNCPRYWYYAFNGALFQQKYKAQYQEAAENGNDTHERIEKYYLASGLDAEVEVKLTYDDPPISGRCDVIVTVDGVTAVADIKTVKSEVFFTRKTEMKPSDSHLLQLLIYMKILKLEYGFMHYIDKNSHESLFIPVRMTSANNRLVDRAFDWMRAIKLNAHDGELPKRSFEKTSVGCRFCPLSKTCWAKSEPDGNIYIEPFGAA